MPLQLIAAVSPAAVLTTPADVTPVTTVLVQLCCCQLLLYYVRRARNARSALAACVLIVLYVPYRITIEDNHVYAVYNSQDTITGPTHPYLDAQVAAAAMLLGNARVRQGYAVYISVFRFHVCVLRSMRDDLTLSLSGSGTFHHSRRIGFLGLGLGTAI